MEFLDRINQNLETIARLKKEIEELKAEYSKSQKPAKWKPSWIPDKKMHTIVMSQAPWNLKLYEAIPSQEKREVGFAYETKKQAATVMHSLNQLALLWAYKYEVEPDWEPDWTNVDHNKYIIYYHHSIKEWCPYHYKTSEKPFIPYFSSKEIVEELCRKLNENEFDLYL